MIKEIVKTIKTFLNENEDWEGVKKNVDDILASIELLQEEKEVENIHEIIKESRQLLKDQMTNILDAPLSKEYIGFVIAYCKLVYNFNLNTLDDPDVALFCKYINKTMELIEFSKIVIDIEKDANIKLNEWKGFNPPAFSLSKALLEEVLNDE